jgi:hypothetical protein
LRGGRGVGRVGRRAVHCGGDFHLGLRQLWAADGCGGDGGVIAVTVLLVAQSTARKEAARQAEKERLEKEEAAKNAPPAWLDPALIPTLLPIGIKAMQVGLKHRGILLALVSSAAIGWAMLRERNKPNEDVDETAAEQPAE